MTNETAPISRKDKTQKAQPLRQTQSYRANYTYLGNLVCAKRLLPPPQISYFIHPTVVRGFFINVARQIFRVLIWTPNVPGAEY